MKPLKGRRGKAQPIAWERRKTETTFKRTTDHHANAGGNLVPVAREVHRSIAGKHGDAVRREDAGAVESDAYVVEEDYDGDEEKDYPSEALSTFAAEEGYDGDLSDSEAEIELSGEQGAEGVKEGVGEEGVDATKGAEATDAKGGRPQKKSTSPLLSKIAAFKDLFTSLIEDILSRDHEAGIGQPCPHPGCKELAAVRCRECQCMKPLCKAHMLEAHRVHPWHWMEVWNGRCFERRDLYELGFVFHLGHSGSTCESREPTTAPHTFTVVHENGIHTVFLHQCHCLDRPTLVSQLVRADLFPATVERPETAFTRDVLRDFILDFEISKKSAQDFMRRIVRKTNGGDISQVKDRYRQLMLSARIYRHLMSTIRAGVAHNIQLPGRREGDLTVPCFSCPWPGVNLPDDWNKVPDRLKYLYRIVFSMDGNFSLQKKTKEDDNDDTALCEGKGFFIPHSEMFASLVDRYGLPEGMSLPAEGPQESETTLAPGGAEKGVGSAEKSVAVGISPEGGSLGSAPSAAAGEVATGGGKAAGGADDAAPAGEGEGRRKSTRIAAQPHKKAGGGEGPSSSSKRKADEGPPSSAKRPRKLKAKKGAAGPSELEGLLETLAFTCSNFKVTRSQRTEKFANLDVSGVIAVVCSHIMFRSHGTADMQAGEGHAHGDAALAGSLYGTEELEEHGITYDVVCQWIRNILRRFEKRYPHLRDIVARMKTLLPSMHIHAHKELCQLVYALYYAQGFGHMHGEGVETPWSELNAAGYSTREMTAGARHDALNALFNFWNWLKLEKIGTMLSKDLLHANKMQESTTRFFAGCCAKAGHAAVEEWFKVPFEHEAPTPATFAAQEKALQNSVLLLAPAKLPSAVKAWDGLVEKINAEGSKSVDQALAGVDRMAVARFIKTGLELQQELMHLRYAHARRAEQKQVIDADLYVGVTWTSFCDKLRRWRGRQAQLMARAGFSSSEGEEDPTLDDKGLVPKVVLGLPSCFKEEEREAHGLEAFQECELVLRIGMAFDLLAQIRQSIYHRSAYISAKRKHARGQKDNAFGEAEIQKAKKLSRELARRYNENFALICELRGKDYQAPDDNSPDSLLRPIDLKDDLKMASMASAREPGQSHATGSWIWDAFDVPPPKARTRSHKEEVPDSDSPEFKQWLRALCAKLRADEAASLKCAEFRRTITGLTFMASLWSSKAEDDKQSPGWRARAHKQAIMWENKAASVKAAYESARADGVQYDRLDHTLGVRGAIEAKWPAMVPDFAKIMSEHSLW